LEEVARKSLDLFCGKCGTVVLNESKFRPGYTNLMVGTLNDSSWVKFDFNIWTNPAPPWAQSSTDKFFVGPILSEEPAKLPFKIKFWCSE
jgi:hypothetical protein